MTRIAPLLAVLWIPVAAAAEEAPETPEPAPREERAPVYPAAGTPAIGLDRLLKVPRGVGSPPTRRGKRDERAWKLEFTTARTELADLERRVAETQEKLGEYSGASMGYSPTPGGIGSNPEVLRLRASLRRDRQSLETAGRRLRDLEVEASLAGVPPEWSEPAE